MRRSLPFAIALLLGGAGCPASEGGKDTAEGDTGADTGTDTDTADTGDTAEPIEPGTETVTATWDVDLFSMYESPTIPMFDTLGGRRQLDGMTIAVDHTATLTVNVENGSDFALAAGDFTHEYNLISIVQLGPADSPDDNPPFFGPGSFLAVQEVALEAADGVEGSGPDFFEETVAETVNFEAHYDWVETPTYLDAMIGEGDLQLVVGGFSESWVWWNEDHGGAAMLYAGASAVQYAGTMTVTYEYSPAEE